MAWERAKILRSWEDWVGSILEASREVFSSNLKGFYVFGSAVSRRLVAARADLWRGTSARLESC